MPTAQGGHAIDPEDENAGEYDSLDEEDEQLDHGGFIGFHRHRHHHPAKGIITGGFMSVTITDAQQIPLTASFTDAGGQADTSGQVSWTSDNPAVVTLDATTGATVNAVAAGVGSANVTASNTDVDGTVFALPALVVTVTAGDATGGTITPGTATAKVVAAPAPPPVA